MSEVTDLDIIVPDPKTVRFGGTEYKVPADMPMEIFLRLNKAGVAKGDDETPDTVAQVMALRDVITDLFLWELEEQPGYTQEQGDQVRENVARVLRKRGTKYTFDLVRSIYKDEDAEDDASGEGEVTEGQAHDVDSNGTTSSTTSQSPTNPTVIPAQAAS